MALTQISNVVTFLDKCIRNVNDLVQNSSMVAVNECLIELNNYDIPATQAQVETISNSLGGSINYVTGISSAGEVDFANGGLCYAVIDDSITESTIDLLFPSAGTYTLLLRQGDTAATVTFTSNFGTILWKSGGGSPSLSIANQGDQLKFTVIEIANGSYIVTGLLEIAGIVFP